MFDPFPLTDAAKRFAEEYLIDFKAGQAALRAGYANTSAGSQLLLDHRVQALIREGKRRASERVNIAVDNTLELLRMIAQADIAPVLKAVNTPGGREAFVQAIEQLPDEVRATIKSIKFTKFGPEITLHDKMAALTLIGKYQGIFVDKHELTGPGGGPLTMITKEMDPKQAAEAYAATIAGTS